MLRGAIGEQRGDRNLDKSVQGIPDQVKDRDLVGKKLESEKQSTHQDYRPRLQYVHRGWQLKSVSVRKQAKGSHRGINVQARGEAGSNYYRQNLIAGDGKHCDHANRKRPPKAAFLKLMILKSLQRTLDLKSPGFQ